MIARPVGRLPRLSRHARLIVWLSITLLLAICFALKIWHQTRLKPIMADFRHRDAMRPKIYEERKTRVKQLFDSIKHRQFTAADLARELNDGTPLPTAMDNGKEVLVWNDPAHNIFIRLRLDDEGYFNGYSTGSGSLSPPRFELPMLLQAIEPARKCFVRDSTVIVLSAFTILLFLSIKRWRVVIAEGMLVLSVICTAAMMLAPHYSLTIRGITSNDNLVVGAIMIGVSTLLLVSSSRMRVDLPPGVCHACGYDLRATPDRCPECGTVPALHA